MLNAKAASWGIGGHDIFAGGITASQLAWIRATVTKGWIAVMARTPMGDNEKQS